MGIKDAFVKGKHSVAEAVSKARQSTGELVERARPSAEKVADAALVSAKQGITSGTLQAKEFLATSRGKKVAAGAAAGAVLGVPIPILGPISGALVGAGLGWWAGLKDAQIVSKLEERCRTLTPTERQQEIAVLDDLHEKGLLSVERYREGRKALTGQ